MPIETKTFTTQVQRPNEEGETQYRYTNKSVNLEFSIQRGQVLNSLCKKHKNCGPTRLTGFNISAIETKKYNLCLQSVIESLPRQVIRSLVNQAYNTEVPNTLDEAAAVAKKNGGKVHYLQDGEGVDTDQRIVSAYVIENTTSKKGRIEIMPESSNPFVEITNETKYEK